MMWCAKLWAAHGNCAQVLYVSLIYRVAVDRMGQKCA